MKMRIYLSRERRRRRQEQGQQQQQQAASWKKICLLSAVVTIILLPECDSFTTTPTKLQQQQQQQQKLFVPCWPCKNSDLNQESILHRHLQMSAQSVETRIRSRSILEPFIESSSSSSNSRRNIIVPTTSFLGEKKKSLKICMNNKMNFPTAAAGRYGGRAEGRPAKGECGRGVLGFVVNEFDLDGVGRLTAKRKLWTLAALPSSSSAPSSLDSEYAAAPNSSSNARRSTRDDSTRSITASPIKKRVTASSASVSQLNVPAWFPWLPTKSQVHILKLAELKEACAERGLPKSGKKSELQQRLLDWTNEQHHRRVVQRRALGDFIAASSSETPTDRTRKQENQLNLPTLQQNQDFTSLQHPDFADTIEPLINRRKALRRARTDQKKRNLPQQSDLTDSSSSLKRFDLHDYDDDDDDYERITSSTLPLDPLRSPTEEYLSALTETFHSPPAKYSNYEVREMYEAAKRADQNGNARLAKRILLKLRDATPGDIRVIRRLARMESHCGNIHNARRILQQGIRQHPKNAHLLHGLAQLELRSGDLNTARHLFTESIRADPYFPNPYHALGTLEHSQGNIKVAMTLFRSGLKMCPSNHRLYHALGDIYRDARMISLAETAYKRGLVHGPNWSRPFFHTALSYLAYEQGDFNACRHLLTQAIEQNHGLHSQGWLSLAQLEESEGRIAMARNIYFQAVTSYERSRLGRAMRSMPSFSGRIHTPSHAIATMDSQFSPNRRTRYLAKTSRSGDRWIAVYKSWARMEEEHGNSERTSQVYVRAMRTFPGDATIVLEFAQYSARNGQYKQARALFERACDKAGNSHADPYRLYAEFEMSQGDYSRAQSILFLGAQSVSESPDGGIGRSDDLARLFHTWAICEWHLSNLDRAEVLFDHSLRLTDAGQDGSEIRSLVLYSIAKFLNDARRELSLAQHCICLSLKENITPGGNSQIWRLWSKIASAMGNVPLAKHCMEHAEKLSLAELDGETDLSRLLGLSSLDNEDGPASLGSIHGGAVQPMLRQEPWHHKIFSSEQNRMSSWYHGIAFPEQQQQQKQSTEPLQGTQQGLELEPVE